MNFLQQLIFDDVDLIQKKKQNELLKFQYVSYHKDITNHIMSKLQQKIL